MPELSRTCHTAQELYEILARIPQEVRQRLPLEIGDEETNLLLGGELIVTAFEGTETEGCIERGFRIEKTC